MAQCWICPSFLAQIRNRLARNRSTASTEIKVRVALAAESGSWSGLRETESRLAALGSLGLGVEGWGGWQWGRLLACTRSGSAVGAAPDTGPARACLHHYDRSAVLRLFCVLSDPFIRIHDSWRLACGSGSGTLLQAQQQQLVYFRLSLAVYSRLDLELTAII